MMYKKFDVKNIQFKFFHSSVYYCCFITTILTNMPGIFIVVVNDVGHVKMHETNSNINFPIKMCLTLLTTIHRMTAK